MPIPAGREAPGNPGGVPFSNLRCCVPGGDGPPGTPGTGPCTRGPPSSRSPGPRPGRAASPTSRTNPARQAGGRSSSAEPALPRPPSCADATRPRPLAPLLSRLSWNCGQRGRRGGEGGRKPERDKGLPAETAGVLLSGGPPGGPWGSQRSLRPLQALRSSTALATGRGLHPLLRSKADTLMKVPRRMPDLS